MKEGRKPATRVYDGVIINFYGVFGGSTFSIRSKCAVLGENASNLMERKLTRIRSDIFSVSRRRNVLSHGVYTLLQMLQS